MILRSNLELKKHYHKLQSGDAFVGMLGFKSLRHAIFVDLMARGVNILPSPLCQVLNNSKTAQARILEPWMLPHTCVITRRTDLMHAIGIYNKSRITAVVTKEDALDCGYGIHRWEHVEAVYNHASFNPQTYPFVLQPFLQHYTDVRVVIAGDHCEAYSRKNMNNFRMNLTSGGKSRPYELNDDLLSFCRQVMKRGRFPFAHIDVLQAEDGRTYLSEIALNGGMKGSRITREELDAIKEEILEEQAKFHQ
jgi:ribosomal protein S6--L-glutamate ligase